MIAFLCCIQLFGQKDISGTEAIDLLKKSHFDFKNEKFPDRAAFFYGENHPYKYADSLSIEVFKKLVKENSVKVFCVEAGKSLEFIFHYYLKNQKLKTKNFDSFDDFTLYSGAFENHFLKPLTRLFKENDSLIIKSYDIEIDLDMALNVLYHIIKNCDSSAYFYDIRTKFRDVHFVKNKIYAQCRFFIKLYDENKKLFRENLSPYEFYYFDKIVEGLAPGIVSDSLEHNGKICESYIYREPFMGKNFSEIIKERNGRNLFACGGGLHLMTKNEFEKLGTSGNCRNYFPFINNLNFKDYIKINCLYPEERRYENQWFLTTEKRAEITAEIPSLKTGRFTFFDVSESKQLFDTSFDFIILCY